MDLNTNKFIGWLEGQRSELSADLCRHVENKDYDLALYATLKAEVISEVGFDAGRAMNSVSGFIDGDALVSSMGATADRLVSQIQLAAEKSCFNEANNLACREKYFRHVIFIISLGDFYE